MHHRAALYTVQVRRKGRGHTNDYLLLGDIDDAGGALIDALAQAANGLQQPNKDWSTTVAVTSVDNSGDELRITTSHGQSGVVADIFRQGAQAFHQVARDTQMVNCATLFVLPRSQPLGWLVVHINNGRSVKGLLCQGLEERLAARHPQLALKVEPSVEASVLRKAVADGLVDRIRLRQLVPPSDRADAQVNRWIPSGDAGKVELEFRSEGRIRTAVLNRFFRGEQNVLPTILEFSGLHFGEASIEVELPSGSHRTFNIQRLEGGHPMTQEMDALTYDADGQPTQDSLFEGLRDALNVLQPTVRAPGTNS